MSVVSSGRGGSAQSSRPPQSARTTSVRAGSTGMRANKAFVGAGLVRPPTATPPSATRPSSAPIRRSPAPPSRGSQTSRVSASPKTTNLATVSEVPKRPGTSRGRPATTRDSRATSPDEYEIYMQKMGDKILAPTSYFFETPAAKDRIDKLNSHHPRTTLARYTCYEKQRDRGFLYPGGQELKIVNKNAQKTDMPTSEDKTVIRVYDRGIPLVNTAQALQIVSRKAAEQCAEVGRFFRMYDKDKSGAIDHDELRALLMNFNVQLSDENYKKFVKHIDPDESGEVGYDEFLAFFGAAIQGEESGGIGDDIIEASLQREKKSKDPLASRKKNGRIPGLVDHDEAIRIITSKLEGQFTEVGRAFRSFDTDNSGCINVAEFRKLLERYCIYLEDMEFRKLWRTLNPVMGSHSIQYETFVDHFSEALKAKDQKDKQELNNSTANNINNTIEEDIFEEVHFYRPKPKTKKKVEVQRQIATPVSVKEEVKVVAVKGPSMEDCAMHMRHNIRTDQNRFRELFYSYDRNGSHQVKPIDFTRILKEYGIVLDDLNFERLMDRILSRGVISYQDACKFFRNADFLDDHQVAELMKHQNVIRKDKNRTPTPVGYRPLSAGASLSKLSFDEIEDRLKKKVLSAYGDFAKAFKAADGNASGKLSYGELRTVLRRFQFKLEDDIFTKLAKKFDRDKDGQIDIEEFLHYFNKPKSRATSVAKAEVNQAVRHGSNSRQARGEAARAAHKAELHSHAYKQLIGKVKTGIKTAASSVLRACAIVDRARTGYCHRAEFKVVFETYLFEIPSEPYLRLIKPFEGVGDKINYKAFVSLYKKT